MNHKIPVVRGLKGMKALKTRHLNVHPAKELLFDGPFYTPCKVTIELENVCMRKIAFIMETSSPDRFIITPSVGVINPKGVTRVKILMYPNVANEDLTNHSFKMSYVVALGNVSVASVNKEWMNAEPLNTTVKTWKCKFKEGFEQNAADTFYDCQSLPTAPIISRPEGDRIEKMKTIKKLTTENARLTEEVHWFKVKSLMEANKANDPRANHICLSDVLDADLEELFMIFGMNLYNMKWCNIRVIVIIMQIAIFLGGLLFAKYLF